MGLVDRALRTGKERAVEAAAKAKDFAVEHREQVKGGIDKAEELADKATKGRYRDKIHKVGERADDAVDRLVDNARDKPADASGEPTVDDAGQPPAGQP